MPAFDVFTLFPSWFAWLVEERHVSNALAGGLELRLHNLRDYSPLKHRMLDDEPYGGGAGMLIRVDVVVAALEGAFAAGLDDLRRDARVIVLDPGGRRFDDGYARELSASPRVVLLCGRYEGFDHRVHDHVATEALSLGPYVVSGGEVAAMVVIDAVSRHLDGALGAAESARHESFSPALGGGLEHPHYTRPPDFRGWRVPDVLLSGDHGAIARWREEQAALRTEAAGDPRSIE
jgi:tRNA (guanine37-N1)-methyltransferase